ncbi:DUF6602 domain-containing protein [Priestia megaterium]|uniref:DUF6602 domain-containing protein n=1 Tax=Priestia megaterium TaxID=1404 RepID=UPI00300A2D03
MSTTKHFANTFFASSIHNAVDKIMIELELVKRLANQHSLEKGREAEGILSGFLKDMLPKKWSVGSGFIVDEESVSTQTDIIIYNELEAPPLYSGYSNVIVPIHTLGCAFEVKMQLNDYESYVNYQKNAKKIKDMYATTIRGKAEPLYVIFVYSTNDSFDLDTLASRLNSSGNHFIDVICIIDKGFVFLKSNKTEYFPYHASHLSEVNKQTVLGYTIETKHMVMVEFYVHLMHEMQSVKTELPDYHSWKDKSLVELLST